MSLEDLDALLDEDASEAQPPSGREIASILGLVAVLGLAMFSFFKKSERLKTMALVASVAYLGFYKASIVSIVNFFSVIDGNVPTFRYSIPLYLLIGFTLVSTILWGRLYCGRICAFGALTQLLDKIVPSKWRIELPPHVDRWALHLKYVVLVAVLAYFLKSRDVLVYRYVEPFWMFTLDGNVLMWTLVALLLVATIFIRNLYCRYLCSVGAALGILSGVTVFKIKRWQECNTCRICEKACEWGAIRGPRIVKRECVRCDDCERIYADPKKCVHWILIEKSSHSGRPVHISAT